MTLGVMRARRRAKFSDQLGDTLQQLAGSLRAGYGLLQAVDGLGQEVSGADEQRVPAARRRGTPRA